MTPSLTLTCHLQKLMAKEANNLKRRTSTLHRFPQAAFSCHHASSLGPLQSGKSNCFNRNISSSLVHTTSAPVVRSLVGHCSSELSKFGFARRTFYIGRSRTRGIFSAEGDQVTGKMTTGKEVSNKQVLFKRYVVGWPTEEDMELVTTTKKLELAGTKEVLVKVLYLSCDPYMRGRMRDSTNSYVPPFQPGKPLSGYGIGKVILSSDPEFVENDHVLGMLNWEEYSIGIRLQKVDTSVVPLSYWLGALGMTGLTAYIGLFEIGKPKKGETVYVSAASGAVGQMVGQFAKLSGCHVVGSAGSKQKIDLLTGKFKYDATFNYKEEPDLEAALKRYCPKGIDIYFENVGGKMLDAVLANMNNFGRIPVCGMISQYNLENEDGIHNLGNIVKKRLLMQGFLQSDYQHLIPEFREKVGGWFKEGKLEYVEDISNGLEAGPKTLIGVLAGKNVGKASIKVADDV